MRLPRFLVWDGAGTLLWIGTFVGTGYLFSAQLERIAAIALRLGAWLVAVLLGALAAYIGWKYVQRHRFIRRLRIARITPEELMRKMGAGEEIVVVDLRHSLEFEADGVSVPGALRFSPDELDAPAPGDSSRSRRRALLHLTQRSDQRPGGAAASPPGHYTSAAVSRRLRGVARPGVPS